MKPEYDAWIASFATSRASVRGLCTLACKLMRETFPELTEVRGWANGMEHAWLTTADGTIVDPTAAQFIPPIRYRAFQPGDEVKVGRCMNCGDDIYKAVERLDDPKYASCVCGPECSKALDAQFNCR